MAKMTIDIINPKIDLIKGLSEDTNSCLSIFKFIIMTSPNATIKVFLERLNNHPEDYKYAQIDIGNSYKKYTSGESITLPSGSAQFRLVIGNAFKMNLKNEADNIQNSSGEICAMTKISVADITNSLSEETIVSRCNLSEPCSKLPPPTANDDEFTVSGGEIKMLDVLANDDANSTITSLSIVIYSQPQEGTIKIVDGEIEYTHTGNTNTTDTFTYKAINDDGIESGLATVTINIPFEGDTSTFTFYPLTEHYAGESGKTGNRYDVNTVNGYTPTDGELLERRKADGSIRESGFADNTYISPAFLEGDTIATTIPLDKIRLFAARYHNIKQLLFTPSIDAPNLEYLKLRGNWANLGTLDLTNNRKLYYIDISMNYIDDILLPTTGENDTDNYFTLAYLGHYQNDAPAPRSVVNKLMRRAYYSNVPDNTPSAVETKKFNSQTSVGTLYYEGVNYHKLLIDKGWSIEHISTEETVSAPTVGGNSTLDFMTSHHNWDLVIPSEIDWLTADKSEGQASNEVQTITFTTTENTTGAPRSTPVYLRKIKEYPRTTSKPEEDGTEFHYKAVINVTQD